MNVSILIERNRSRQFARCRINMIVTYIQHSCFSIELDNVILLFDYFNGTIPLYPKDKHIFVFASHKHQDHFNLSIFDLAKLYPNITFVLSKYIRLGKNYLQRNNIPEKINDNICFVGAKQRLSLPAFSLVNPSLLIQVETLKSTDVGVAFLITVQDKTIYHAGDLNWWTWIGETEDEYQSMTSRFQKEINTLIGRDIDIAFLPLDPRQEERYWWGFDYFMKHIHAGYAFPMHFWKDYSIIEKMKNSDNAKEYSDKIMDINEEGQRFILD